MWLFLSTYIATSLLLLLLLAITSSVGFPSMDRKGKISTVISITLISILWFPVLVFIAIWTVVRKIRGNDLQN